MSRLASGLLALAAAGGGCALGPDYERPVFKDIEETKKFAGDDLWKPARPRDAVPKGEWWRIYGDAALDRLAARATERSADARVALARLEQARAAAGIEGAALWPELTGRAGASRSRTERNRRTGADAYTQNAFSLGGDLSYELDLWGRVRRTTEAADARAEAALADYHNALLSVQAEVARNYFALRALDAERALVVRNIESRRKSLALVARRQELGAGTELDTRLAEAELASSESDRADIDQRRAQLRLALAVLCDENPSAFALAEDARAALAEPPPVPSGLPSALLERRPDIASAERAVAAANAEVGAAKAAFFPTLVLFAGAGYASADVGKLFTPAQWKWNFGPSLTLPFFEGGRLRADHRRSLARREEAVAQYRQRVLEAFREVEACLSDLARLAERNAAMSRAVVASRRAATLVNERYIRGHDSYMDVLNAERTAIANERLDVQVRGQRLVASALLVKAVGGGWKEQE
ncbi:MAG: efflux transporter outer membrane subunit [Puniceicoccales bacterium]|nr:efflux transporter outer membrane subunit [Puniceicoccales bacterium]